jgi:hypothetical protein
VCLFFILFIFAAVVVAGGLQIRAAELRQILLELGPVWFLRFFFYFFSLLLKSMLGLFSKKISCVCYFCVQAYIKIAQAVSSRPVSCFNSYILINYDSFFFNAVEEKEKAEKLSIGKNLN